MDWSSLVSVCWRLVILCAVVEFKVSRTYKESGERRHFLYNPYPHTGVPQLNKNKVNTLGPILKRHVAELRQTANKKVDIIFLVDSSSSVGPHDFINEVKFVKKLLADFTVDSNHTRVSVVTFSSKSRVLRQIDYITANSDDKHKCSLLEEDLPKIKFKGGGTYTLGAFIQAKDMFSNSRSDSNKAVFLITDGFSNGGDPRPEAKYLRRTGVKIFTFGIRNGNIRELYDMASEPKNETCYILDTFEEFESLARRALHEDLSMGSFIQQPTDRCSHLCHGGGQCCDTRATCGCGTHVGQFLCVCQRGYYGTGLRDECFPCPSGTYKESKGPGDVTSCKTCPDMNHITEPGAVSASQCVCKKGFRSSNETSCLAFTCPTLTPPRHGYFVNDKCNNVFNAACGLKCKPGYDLHGSSLRICQEGGVWSGSPTECIMKTCPALPRPNNGNMICSNDDFTFSTMCRFTCDTGYKLVGSRKRQCLANALWTGIPTRCREITCHPLPSVIDGSISPNKCKTGEVSFGTTCTITCHAGYTLVGPGRKQCTPDGTWAPSMDGEMSRCNDTEPPLLQCPFDVEVPADEFDNTAEADWVVPLALDNSGFLPLVTVVPAVEPPKRFPIGLTAVKYTAEDYEGNKARCHFSVIIKDVTPPTVDQCYSPLPFVSAERYANVTWDEPEFSDNSGEKVRVERSHEPGLFRQGKTIVRYDAFDESGNNSTCEVEIIVIPHPCQYPDPPISGDRECRETEEGVYCRVTCNEGYAFAIPPAEEYFCAYDNIWRPEDKMPIPDCSVETLSDGIFQPASITYLSSVPCTEHIVLQDIQLSFERKVRQKVNTLCSDNILCTVEDFETTCEQKEDFNTIRVVLGRDKRSLDRESHDVSKRRAPGITASSTITFDFNIKGEVTKSGNVSADFRRQGMLPDSLSTVLHKLEQKAVHGELDLEMSGKKMQFSNMTYDSKGPQYKCNPGSVNVDSLCVYCAAGTYFNVITEKCDGCRTGSFQPTEGQLTCVVCPSNTSTHANFSKSENECKALCLPGTFSKDGLERCATCPLGTYQTLYGQTSCTLCPANQTTIRRGSRQISQCKDRCRNGYVSKTGLEPCYPCPRGTYQPEKGMSSCFRCPGEGTTIDRASTKLSDCEGNWDTEMQADVPGEFPPQQLEVNECFNDQCQNGATCNFRDFGFYCECVPGFEGIYCQNETNECEGNPCLNSGVCLDLQADYSCQCPAGYTGKKCEVDIDDCSGSPCLNNGTCVDGVNRFNCSCATGYEGDTCDRLTDDCKNGPCQNGGSCQNVLEGYTCTCPTGYEGVDCEINPDECESFPCQNDGQCQDGIGAFSCICFPGYTGKTCDVNIDECDPSPCSSLSTCEDQINGFLCHCPSGFTGTKCESELSDNYMLDFPRSGLINYTTTTIDVDMTALTVSFWMKTDDDTSQGTPFSYSSSPEMDNAFTLTNYEGFVISVNNHKQVTDVFANDGLWHHIIVTWASNRGSWKIYKDGVVWDSGYNLAAGETIAGGGTFVVGQEQDPDGFSSSESFIGQITRLNLWSEELPLTTIDEMRISCDVGNGDIIAWPDIQSGMRGTLTAEPSNFCRDCPVPVTPTYGTISYTGTTPGSLVTYDCLRGFHVAGRDRRMCLVTGEWEGQRSPTCQRVDCGYPGSIRNGFVEGIFSYDNRVRYICYDGYKRTGNATRYCNADGYWEGAIPSCDRVKCTLPELSENTRVLNSSNTFVPGDVTAFGCAQGHTLYTTYSTVLCQNDGTFDKSVPTCDLQTCKEPPNVDLATPDVILEEYSVGYILTYECSFAYKLSERSVNPTGKIRCLPNGEWEENLPKCTIITCEDPPKIINGRSIWTDNTFLSSAEYVCDVGYTMIGENTVECIESGLWIPHPPECIPVDCGAPENVPNSIIKADSYSYKSVATYQCNGGYEIQGESQINCTQDGSWSSGLPVCNPVSCGIPDSIENGRFIGYEYTYGNTVRYQCDEGYLIGGVQERTCGQDGQWTSHIPSCRRLECVQPPLISNGYFINSGFYFGDEVEYSCDTGYVLQGNTSLTCQSDGSWQPAPPSCSPVQCPILTEIENGNTIMHGRTFTSKAEYSCISGYDLVGESIRICQPEGDWSGNAPSCKAGRCPSPLPIANGNVNFKELTLGSVAMYECDRGFSLSGVSVRRCLQTLTWEGTEPTCEVVTCSEPPDIENGRKLKSGLRFKAITTYECDTGFLLVGSTNLTCSESAIWAGTIPTCELVQCETPSTVTSNGRMLGTNFTYGNTIRYECDIGYNLVGAANRTCQANEEWDAPIPICEIVKCPRAFLPNGFPSSFKTEYDSVISFTCRSGYVLFGSAERTCLDSGLWSGQAPVCVICDKPPSVDFAISTVNNGVVAYECNTGYQLSGLQELNCQSDGTWAGQPPTCTPNECTDLDLESFVNGSISLDGATVGSSAQYECDEGFILVGGATRRCLSDGTWSGQAPFCSIVRCPGTFFIENGEISDTFDNVYKTVLSFTCNRGFVINGSQAVICQANGTWNGTEPTCDAILCPQPEEIMHGTTTISSLKFNSVVTYTCENGYEANGVLYRTCEENGEWSGSAPTCIAIACEPPKPLENGQIIGTKYTLGSQIRYRCNPGYILNSLAFRLCLDSKIWSGPEPSCEKVRCRRPRPPPRGRIKSPRQDNYFFGDVIEIECNEGYKMTRGTPTRTCRENRKWSLPFPRCTVIMCDKVPSKPNAVTTLINGSTTYNSQLRIQCNEGYVSALGSSVISTCQLDSHWSTVQLNCTRAQCADIPVIPNAQVVGNSFLFGDSITIQCNTGYFISGESELTCLGNGIWSALNYPTCSIISCGRPEDIENGEIQALSQFDYNQEVIYHCSDGYQLIGSEQRRCQLDGQWSGSAPTCKLLTCTVPTIWKGTPILEKQIYVVGDSLSYTCNEGYVMVGNTDIVCTSDGFWNGSLPQCDRIMCPAPEEIWNGEVMNKDLVYQSRAIYSCDEGFELEGDSVLTCMENGMWSSEYPVCNPVSCGEPNFVANSGVLGDVYTYGNIVTYFCEDGYSLEGDDVLICLEDATWSSLPPRCVPISCGPPPEIVDAIRNGDSFYFKDTVFYKCDIGYELSGNNILRCASNSLWEGDLPICQPVECGPPPVLPHSTTIVTTTTFGSVITYLCNRGYVLRGDPMAKCSEKGTWTHDRSVACIAVDCGPPPTFPFSQTDVSSTKYPSVASYQCIPGYEMSGNSAFRCEESGEWVGSKPLCIKDSCSSPVINNNVILTGIDFSFGGTVTFSCPLGYNLVGSTSASCTSSGIWSNSSPECHIVSCGQYPVFDTNIIVRTGRKSNYVFGDYIDFICNEGYVLSSTMSARCLANGRWSAENPTCIQENVEACPQRNDVAHAQTIPTAYRVGEMYTVLCMPGYRSVGDLQVTCTSENVWSNPTGLCRRVSCGKPRVTDMVNVIRISGRSYFYGDKIHFRCRPGIAPIKIPPILTCQSSGRWDGEIACSLPCKGGCFNGGRCLGLYGCKCPAGYGGRRCEKALCILPCLHGGRCIAPYTCACRAGYTGVRCQKPICKRPCQNGGRCIKPNRCQCLHGFKGPFCENSVYTRTLPPFHLDVRQTSTFLPERWTTPRPTTTTTEEPRTTTKASTQPATTTVPSTTNPATTTVSTTTKLRTTPSPTTTKPTTTSPATTKPTTTSPITTKPTTTLPLTDKPTTTPQDFDFDFAIPPPS